MITRKLESHVEGGDRGRVKKVWAGEILGVLSAGKWIVSVRLVWEQAGRKGRCEICGTRLS